MPKTAEDKVNRMLACMDKIVEAHWVPTARKSEVTASPKYAGKVILQKLVLVFPRGHLLTGLSLDMSETCAPDYLQSPYWEYVVWNLAFPPSGARLPLTAVIDMT